MRIACAFANLDAWSISSQHTISPHEQCYACGSQGMANAAISDNIFQHLKIVFQEQENI